jgi:uncharacterized sulfatase
MKNWILAGCIFTCGLTSAEQTRPNILWLSTEDISPHLGCYGDPDAITPNLDALAERGMRYSHAFTVAPVCAPNRSSIITGMYPATIGTHHMRAGGEGVERSINPKLHPNIKPFPIYLREAGYYCTNNSKKDYNFAPTNPIWDESSKKAHWKNRSSEDTPFFAVFNYTDTHEGSIRSNPTQFAQKTKRLTEAQRRDPSKLTIPPYHPDTPVVREQWRNIHELITGMDYWVADHLKALDEAGLAENTIVIFWSDHGTGLPRHKRWVYDSGVHVPLIVYAPEKWQKKFDITPGTVVDDLVSSIDLGPSTLNMAGVDIPKHMQGEPFLGTNLPEPREYVFGGRDRMDERYDMIRYVRNKRYKLVVNYMPFKPYLQYTNTAQKSPVHQEYQRLIAEGSLPEGSQWVAKKAKPYLEFYDLESDPHEMSNLMTDSNFPPPGIRDEFRAMAQAHRKWLSGTMDLGIMPEAEMIRLEKEYEFRSNIIGMDDSDGASFIWKAFELVSLPEKAFEQRVNRNEEESMEMLQEAIVTGHPTARYWATLAFSRMPNARDDLATIVTEDESMVVRIAAAQALVSENRYQTYALSILEQGLRDDDEWVRLQAATALDEIGELARPAIPAMTRALGDKHNKYVVRVVNHSLNILESTNNQVR